MEGKPYLKSKEAQALKTREISCEGRSVSQGLEENQMHMRNIFLNDQICISYKSQYLTLFDTETKRGAGIWPCHNKFKAEAH